MNSITVSELKHMASFNAVITQMVAASAAIHGQLLSALLPLAIAYLPP